MTTASIVTPPFRLTVERSEVRDLEEEARTGGGWMCYKPGPTATLTLDGPAEEVIEIAKAVRARLAAREVDSCQLADCTLFVKEIQGVRYCAQGHKQEGVSA